MKIIRTTHDDKYTQFTLGDLIRAIEKYDIPNDDGSYKEVVFDFGSTAPSGNHVSSRGTIEKSYLPRCISAFGWVRFICSAVEYAGCFHYVLLCI